VAVLRPVATADPPQAGQEPSKIAVKRAELFSVAVIQFGHVVQFGMAHP
jgi:hypothetical protein